MSKYQYEDAIKQLQDTGSISLVDLKNLTHEELVELLEEIKVRWLVNESGQGEFSVTDTGFGIASEHLSRLTERFYRVDRSRSRDTGGTGLGLAIVKHIASRHQAQLLIESTPGKGSTFTLRFPKERISP